jgi:hypothetical protein
MSRSEGFHPNRACIHCCSLFAIFIFYEPISRLHIRTFAVIWAALSIYAIDSEILYRKPGVRPERS